MSQSPAGLLSEPLSVRAGCFLFLLFPLSAFSSLPVVVVLLPSSAFYPEASAVRRTAFFGPLQHHEAGSLLS